MMNRAENLFLFMLCVNTGAAVCYFAWNVLVREKKRRLTNWIELIVMLLCPVAGPCFFLVSQILYLLFFRQDVDLEDVIFNKERVKTHLRADEEQEGNLVPIEEALAVSDKDNLRKLVMNVVRGEVEDSLASISLALNSEDTETSHYAASVLQDTLNEFCRYAQKLYLQMEQGKADAPQAACQLIEYMYGVLVQDVFHEKEQETYVHMMEEACCFLEVRSPKKLTSTYLEWLCTLLLKEKNLKRMRYWCEKAKEWYPMELSTYTCYLKLYFTEGNRKKFLEELKCLKDSDIVIDQATLELIRTFC